GEVKNRRVIPGAGDIESLDIQKRRQPGIERGSKEFDAEVTRAHRQNDRIARQSRVLLKGDALCLRRLDDSWFGGSFIDDGRESQILGPVPLPEENHPPNREA